MMGRKQILNITGVQNDAAKTKFMGYIDPGFRGSVRAVRAIVAQDADNTALFRIDMNGNPLFASQSVTSAGIGTPEVIVPTSNEYSGASATYAEFVITASGASPSSMHAALVVEELFRPT